MTDIPPSVTVGPHVFAVTHDDDTVRRLRAEGRRGDSCTDRNTISVDCDRAHTAVAETLLHEVIHCCWTAAGLQEHPSTEHEEAIICALAPQLLAALRTNPDLTAYLTQ